MFGSLEKKMDSEVESQAKSGISMTILLHPTAVPWLRVEDDMDP